MFDSDIHVKKAAKLLKAVGNPQRLQILTQLVDGEKNVGEINAYVDISQPALSQHLARMRAAGILISRRNQRQIYYAIGDAHILRALEVIARLTHPLENIKISA